MASSSEVYSVKFSKHDRPSITYLIQTNNNQYLQILAKLISSGGTINLTNKLSGSYSFDNFNAIVY